jgi:hypothetical protein
MGSVSTARGRPRLAPVRGSQRFVNQTRRPPGRHSSVGGLARSSGRSKRGAEAPAPSASARAAVNADSPASPAPSASQAEDTDRPQEVHAGKSSAGDRPMINPRPRSAIAQCGWPSGRPHGANPQQYDNGLAGAGPMERDGRILGVAAVQARAVLDRTACYFASEEVCFGSSRSHACPFRAASDDPQKKSVSRFWPEQPTFKHSGGLSRMIRHEGWNP